MSVVRCTIKPRQVLVRYRMPVHLISHSRMQSEQLQWFETSNPRRNIRACTQLNSCWQNTPVCMRIVITFFNRLFVELECFTEIKFCSGISPLLDRWGLACSAFRENVVWSGAACGDLPWCFSGYCAYCLVNNSTLRNLRTTFWQRSSAVVNNLCVIWWAC